MNGPETYQYSVARCRILQTINLSLEIRMLERGFTRTLAALVMIALPAITWAAGSGESSGPGSLVVPLGMMLLGATVLAILLSYVKQSSLLAFIGVKIVIDVLFGVTIPTWASLLVIVATLGAGMLASACPSCHLSGAQTAERRA